MVAPAPYYNPLLAPFKIPYYAWNSSGTLDELGNKIPAWNPGVLVDVQGWDILSSEVLGEHVAGEKFEVFLQVPPDFWPQVQDRFGLAIPSNGMVAPATMFDSNGRVNKGIFEVTGHDIETNGFHGWRPGNIILLKLVEG